jgi:hypothetical protein
MSPNGVEERSGREIRLLALVIVIAVAGLLVLARFRFPTADIVAVTPAPTALAPLALKAPFQDLAGAVADASERLSALVLVVEFNRTPEKAPRKSQTPAAPLPAQRRLLPGLRVRPDLVLAYAPAGWHPAAAAGVPALLLAGDPRREIALVGADSRTGEHVLPPGDVADSANGVSVLTPSSYLLAVEGAPGGPAIRPIFVPRTDPVTEDRWPSPILRIGGDAQVGAGAFLFTVDGRLVGLTVPQENGIAIVTAVTLGRLIADLTSGHQ